MPKAGKSRSLHSSEEGLHESDEKKRRYGDTTHDYGNLFEYKKRDSYI